MDDSTSVAVRRNGASGGIFEITNLVFTRRTVRVGDRELQGWVRGPGCRRSVDAEYRAALARYTRAAAEYAQRLVPLAEQGALDGLLPQLREAARLALQDSAEGYERFLELAPAIQQVTTAPIVDDPVAWAEFLNEALMLVLPGLSLEEAEAMDDSTAFAVLRHLGWFAPLDAGGDEEGGEATDPPETSASETSAT